ncbi:hypothetical protein KM043_015365 [Ampulex compressa]|nr:hypothetical protein KM043_015365 [Ampulex compressa]
MRRHAYGGVLQLFPLGGNKDQERLDKAKAPLVPRSRCRVSDPRAPVCSTIVAQLTSADQIRGSISSAGWSAKERTIDRPLRVPPAELRSMRSISSHLESSWDNP